jgi:hypothetical protein
MGLTTIIIKQSHLGQGPRNIQQHNAVGANASAEVRTLNRAGCQRYIATPYQ